MATPVTPFEIRPPPVTTTAHADTADLITQSVTSHMGWRAGFCTSHSCKVNSGELQSCQKQCRGNSQEVLNYLLARLIAGYNDRQSNSVQLSHLLRLLSATACRSHRNYLESSDSTVLLCHFLLPAWIKLTQCLEKHINELWQVKPDNFKYPTMKIPTFFTAERISQMSLGVLPFLFPLCLLPPAFEDHSAIEDSTNDTTSTGDTSSSAINATSSSPFETLTSPVDMPSASSNTGLADLADFADFQGMEDTTNYNYDGSSGLEAVEDVQSWSGYFSSSYDATPTPAKKRKYNATEIVEGDRAVFKRGKLSASSSSPADEGVGSFGPPPGYSRCASGYEI
ncbi:hypothetical protein AC578_4118 [Pseudocercospora eumusae]|uniref:Uncharacterized protein n=1 Tax=Pseudocercospora eumusae TaxID=321146 RepID=A0A139HF30_9PEZI|nr:hypothetical protein AC578_4118 [Pseudocercospora eumusae]